MSIYTELDTIIADYVGYVEQGYDIDEYTNQVYPNYDCADIDLYNSIVEEVTRHLNGEMPSKHLSKDAQICIENWESLIQSYKENYTERNCQCLN